MIYCKDLGFSYGKSGFRLEVEELEISPGEIVGLAGNNGMGKTTLFRLILDLAKPGSGFVEIGGTKVDKGEDWKRFTGSFLGESYLVDFLSPREYFEFVGFLNSSPVVSFFKEHPLVEVFFNGEVLDQNKLIGGFSTGNRHKIGIAGALLNKPKLVLLDEPFANLDPGGQLCLKKIIRDFNSRYQTTFVVSSHNLQHITEISDRVILMRNGKIVRDIQNEPGTLQELNVFFAEGA